MSEMTKICTQCREEKNIKEFSVIKNRKGIKNRTNSWCKQCCSLKGRKWNNDNSEKVKAYQKEYKKAHAQESEVYNRKWEKNNPEKTKQTRRKSDIKCRKGVSISYAKALLCANNSLKHSDIPDEMARVHRTILKFKRYLRSIESGKDQKGNQGACKESRRCVG